MTTLWCCHGLHAIAVRDSSSYVGYPKSSRGGDVTQASGIASLKSSYIAIGDCRWNADFKIRVPKFAGKWKMGLKS